ncbi:response regulator [Paenibacillus sp. LMG 31456]|uniref:Circadian input-output histidine kinase CikA n=1 Tax=Paenibacillus foliorum TaxID=2654974 RepID=A0A972GPK9_9BACL|nr:response regulator [Paenibacillus foliorum]NOU92069.1 response regulator [Paenibacillus foliorum]
MLKNRKWNIGSKIGLGYFLVILCMGMSIFFLMDRIYALQKEISFITDHDLAVHTLSNQIEKHILDMETGQRGYIITGEVQYLEPYNEGKSKWLSGYNELYPLIADNPAQLKNLEAIKANIETWIAVSGEKVIPLRNENKMVEILQYYKADPGKRYMDLMRNQWDSFRSVEKELTAARVADLEARNIELQTTMYLLALLAVVLSVLGTTMVSRSIVLTIKQVVSALQKIASSEGNLNTSIEVRTNDEVRELADAANTLLESVRKQDWLKTGIAEVASMNQGVNNITELGSLFIGKMASILDASYGAFYIRTGRGEYQRLTKIASYAGDGGNAIGKQELRMGEGLVGQAALENRMFLLQDIPDSYIHISSGLGHAAPKSILITPIQYEGKVEAVVELASLQPFSELHQELLQQIRCSFGIAVNSVLGRMEIDRLLAESQAFTEELQTQSEELQAQSEELLSQQEEMKVSNDFLKKSEERMQRHQEDLEKVNLELSKRSYQLEAQVRFTEEVNSEIERQREALQKQTEELSAMSQYKSEFLANMSHELRTPLNSMLILSQFLGENKDGNLSGEQVEFANTIHASGSDLLRLIDEILDLSKVEAGKLDLNVDITIIEEIGEQMRRSFQPVAAKRALQFRIEAESDVPPYFYTDSHRLMQILKNFLSNAFKFTEKGQIVLRIYVTDYAFSLNADGGKQKAIAFAVTDTGIGIPEDKRALIFEAFQQVDGTTSRKYGGTGLGLTISRELAQILGAEIGLESQDGQGSTFTLYMPVVTDLDELSSEPIGEIAAAVEPLAASMGSGVPHISEIVIPEVVLSDPRLLAPGEVKDDRDSIDSDDRLMLIVEDDVPFAQFILDMARSRGFKGIVATQGDKGLALAYTYKPDMIMLDIHLPVMDGWTVLDLLKQNPETRHIPVHVLSVADEPQQSLVSGAMAYLKKPISTEMLVKAFEKVEDILNRTPKRLLIVEDNIPLRKSLVELIGHDDVAIRDVGYGQEALQELNTGHFDCMVLDLELADMSGFELLDRIRNIEKLHTLPIIIFTGKDLDLKQERELRKYAESIIVKNVKSQERLYAEVALYLHRVEAQLPEERRMLLKSLQNGEDVFEGKHILLVEDDIRNVFALTNVLERHNLKVTYVENGSEALKILQMNPGIDLVLMDIMMPEMDGYEAMKHIRSNPEHNQLPIIALTAKAMKEDRQKCMDAGASDYISKPINTDKLLSLLKVWLYK